MLHTKQICRMKSSPSWDVYTRYGFRGAVSFGDGPFTADFPGPRTLGGGGESDSASAAASAARAPGNCYTPAPTNKHSHAHATKTG
jgi:hypothetical protein